MTSTNLIQREQRAFVVYRTLPEGCISFMCADQSSMPHIRPGECVVVDTTDRRPVVGDVYVIKFGPEIQHHHICVVRHSRLAEAKICVGAITNDVVRRAFDRIEATDRTRVEKNKLLITAHNLAGGWTEGPYGPEGSPSYDHLCNCLVGRVIGLLEPDFEGPLRKGGR